MEFADTLPYIGLGLFAYALVAIITNLVALNRNVRELLVVAKTTPLQDVEGLVRDVRTHLLYGNGMAGPPWLSIKKDLERIIDRLEGR